MQKYDSSKKVLYIEKEKKPDIDILADPSNTALL